MKLTYCVSLNATSETFLITTYDENKSFLAPNCMLSKFQTACPVSSFEVLGTAAILFAGFEVATQWEANCGRSSMGASTEQRGRQGLDTKSWYSGDSQPYLSLCEVQTQVPEFHFPQFSIFANCVHRTVFLYILHTFDILKRCFSLWI